MGVCLGGPIGGFVIGVAIAVVKDSLTGMLGLSGGTGTVGGLVLCLRMILVLTLSVCLNLITP